MPESFSAHTLGEIIAKVLGLKPGDDIEVQVDKTNRDRLMVIRHGQKQKAGSSLSER